jgi:formate/nitrite transporter FocA (FNT family)
LQHRWVAAFGFGLVHGFGFSFLFSDTLQFAGGHLFSSLLAFNVGVELGQILVLILVIPLLRILFRFFVQERVGTILLSALVAHSAWHWMLDRGNTLAQFQMQMPILDSIFFAGLMRWGMMLILIGLALWGMYELFRRFSLVENMTSYGESRDAES